MPPFFTSFDDAREHFRGRSEPLESFWETLPDDPGATVDRWIIEPPDEVRDAAARLQRAFADLPWIAPVPRHYLHVTLREGGGWRSAAPFEAEYGPAFAFPVAVVAEVRAPALQAVARDPRFLPHLSLGYFRQTHDPEPLRRTLEPLRETGLGSATVHEVQRVRIPVGRERFLEPWTVLERVALESPR